MALLPLVRDGVLIGSWHLGSKDVDRFELLKKIEFIRYLAAMVGICFDNCINQEKLAQLSLVDMVTRVSNRRAFDIETVKEVSRAHRNKTSLTTIFIYLDDFEEINSSIGSTSGERVVRVVAEKIQVLLRCTDHIARYSTDEFSVILTSCGQTEGVNIAERIRADIESLSIDDGRGGNLTITGSLGVCTWVPEHSPVINMKQLSNQLVDSTRKVLARAKTQGNQVIVGRLKSLVV